MNKFLVFAAAAAFCAMPSMAKKKKEVIPADSLVFTTVLENGVTSIKNQNNSGTCWSYSALAFLESEVLKKDPARRTSTFASHSSLARLTLTVLTATFALTTTLASARVVLSMTLSSAWSAMV